VKHKSDEYTGKHQKRARKRKLGRNTHRCARSDGQGGINPENCLPVPKIRKF